MPSIAWKRLAVGFALACLAHARPGAAAVRFESGSFYVSVGSGATATEVFETFDALPYDERRALQSASGRESASLDVNVVPGTDGFALVGRGFVSVEPGGGLAQARFSVVYCIEPFEGGAPGFAHTARITIDPPDVSLAPAGLIVADYIGPEERTELGAGHLALRDGGGSGEAAVEDEGSFGSSFDLCESGSKSVQGLVTVNLPPSALSVPATAEFELEVTIGAASPPPPPPDGACEGDELVWSAGRSGAFADPESWSPPQVPVFEDGGPCDTARVEGGGVVTIDLGSTLARAAGPLAERAPRGGDRRAGRLHVFDTRELRLAGGTLVLDALEDALGERSLEVSNAGGILLADGTVAARHVAIGSGAGPGGQIEVVGPGGALTTTARLGLGGGGEGRLLVREGGRVTSAESVIGESVAKGAAIVQDPGSLWRTANATVGYGFRGTLEVRDGARVESERAFIGLGLDVLQSSVATVAGADAQGNRATWAMDDLEVRNGSLNVAGGGLVDVAGALELSAQGDAGGNIFLGDGGQIAASNLSVDDGLVFVSGPSLLFVTGDLLLGDSVASPLGGGLFVTGPATSAQVSGAELLALEADSLATLHEGARLELLGTFNVGTEPGSSSTLVVGGARPRESLLRANEGDVFTSVVGAPSGAPAAERLAPTGTLRLEGGRIELQGPDHDLVVERLGRLVAAGGSLSIETPGELVNRGVVEGPFILEAPYVQGETGTRRATILFEGDAGAPRARAVDPLAAAAFPRRALRKKPALPVAGPLVVQGGATLAGRVELQFGNGAAPRAGESFAVLDVAGPVTGAFADVAIRGLVPGSFAFEPSLAGGKLALVSTTDAVALPAVSLKAKARLKETARKGGKIKVKRAGDTSAPLLVAYTVGGTAQPSVDYEALPGVIEIPARKKSATIVVTPLADGLAEPPETIELELAPNEAFAPGLASRATIELVGAKR